MLDKEFFSPNNFLSLPPEYSDLKKSEFVILPVPFEQTVTFRTGTKDGPQAIINASGEVELFDEELGSEPYKKGISTLEPLEVISSGGEQMIRRIYQVTKELLKSNKKIIMLGGEHTISIGLVKALKEKYPDFSVLQLDAHADLRDSYQESKFNHACVMRRIREICPAVQVGIRNISLEEHQWVDKGKINLFYAKNLKKNKNWIEDVINSLSDNIYLTLDVDFFDPSIMPACGTPEPGGLLWYETLDFLRKVIQKRNLISFDVVELSPQTGNVAPEFMIAKLIYKLIGYSVQKNRSKVS